MFYLTNALEVIQSPPLDTVCELMFEHERRKLELVRISSWFEN